MKPFNSEGIYNLPQHLYQYLYLLQLVGYFPYVPHRQIDTTKDNRMILGELWELGDIKPTYITIPNVNQRYTHLWN